MQLTDDQKQQVSQWIASGAKLSEIQSRLDQELGIRLTYMDARLLVDDLKLTPQDPVEPEVPEEKTGAEATAAEGAVPGPLGDEVLPPGASRVAVSVDQLARPGAMVSGKVTFSDGQSAEWYLDQQGRLGMVPGQPGYRPPEGDVQEFQLALEKELMKSGF
jgi:hypothetical protein